MLGHESIITSLRQSCIDRRIPCLSENTQTYLVNSLHLHRPQVCREIGSASGLSTIVIGAAIRDRGGKVTSYEISYPHYKEALSYTDQILPGIVTIYPLSILTIPQTNTAHFGVDTCIDWAFIDGRKSEYGLYVQKIWPHVASGGVLILDDVIKYSDKLGGLYDFIAKNQVNYTLHHLDSDDGIMEIIKS